MAEGTTAPEQASAAPELGTFGFDMAGMDRSANPGDDFYEYANGTWAATTEIPADKSNYGMFTRLDEISKARTREILDEARADSSSKIGRAYASFLNEGAVNAAGLTPLQPWLDRVSAIVTKADYARAVGEADRYGVGGPVGVYVNQDEKDPNVYALNMVQSGLGLPDRDYYLSDDEKFVDIRAKYALHIARMMELAGEEDAAARAAAIVGYETKIANVHWTRTESRDADKTYNKRTLAALDAATPGFSVSDYFAGSGIDVDSLIVAQPSAVEGIAKIVADTPLAVLKDALNFRTLSSYADYLPARFVDENFGFYGTVLSGTPENQPRWKRGVDFVTSILGEEVGKTYVARHFPPETKAQADALVQNVIAAMDRRLQGLDWMAPETKVKARQKLAAFTPKIGYPDEWRDYSALEIESGDLLGNAMRGAEFEHQRNLNKLGGPIDRSEWFMTPMTVNAYANPVMNEIVFPASILQPPFFDPDADPAINYGGIGAVIGHEISHHFDDQGRKYDMNGALSEWWTPGDVERFDALTAQLVDQYDAYEIFPGMNVKGGLTLGENIADLAGLTMAHDAYRMSLNGEEAPVLEGLTGDQRFYLGWAQVWRRNYREENLRQRLVTDPHSPSIQRVWVVRNLDPWYAAYTPGADAELFLSPDQRVKIW
ncbi:MAG: M13-type metalloendopeptidase [Pacificimonas sp.]